MEKVQAKCSNCPSITEISRAALDRHLTKRPHYLCRRCLQKSVWQNPDLLDKLSANIKASEKYQEGIKNRPDSSGTNNSMFGKKLSDETKAKMSKSRIGKTGESATAWKGGKNSIYRRVKALVFRRLLWGKRVFERDGYKCRTCSSTERLDAHHIVPLKQIFTEASKYLPSSLGESEKIEWYLRYQEISDDSLSNGITLCRACHKNEHNNWGSHEPK